MDDIQQQMANLTALVQTLTQNTQQKIQWLHLTDRNKAKATLENFKVFLSHLSITIRYNEMTKEEEILIPGWQFHPDTANNAAFAVLLSESNRLDFAVSVDTLSKMVTICANENSYHPVRDWIDSTTWDGQSRLQEFYDTVISENSLKETLMRKWALSAVAAVYHESFSCEGVLCFQGEQGLGKTTSVMSWLPAGFRDSWLKDGVHIDPKKKDDLMKVMSYWIVELGELDATFRKADIEVLKAFITERSDVLRKPFERKTESFNRKTVFYASVNDPEFLQDDQNRRFWVLNVTGFRAPAYDVSQFWAEMREIYFSIRPKIQTLEDRITNSEWGWFLSPEERRQLEQCQASHIAVNPVDQILENKVVLGGRDSKWLNATAILQRCGVLNPTPKDCRRAGTWLRKKGYKQNSERRYDIEISDDANEVALAKKRLNMKVINPERD